MTRQQVLDKRDVFNQVHGVTLRAIETFADHELDFRPKPGMRTPRELVFHIYGQEQALAEAARDGSFTIELANTSNPEDPSRAAAVSVLATVADAVGYARACHDAAERIFRAMSEDVLARPVNSPFGTYPAWQYLVFACADRAAARLGSTSSRPPLFCPRYAGAMLYLVGGPPRSGKTTLAAALAQRTSFPYFSIDHIAQVIVPYIPEPDHATRLPLRVAIQEAQYSNDAFYSKYSPEQAVALYQRQAATVWAGVENFIKYALNADHDLIIEGWQIIPSRLRSIVAGCDRVKVVFLYKLHEVDIVSGLKAHSAKNDWVITNTQREDTFNAIGKMISGFGADIEREAASNGFRAVNTDRDFYAAIMQTVEFLLT